MRRPQRVAGTDIAVLRDETLQNDTFCKSGAFNEARWMAKLIYSLKIVMLSNEIESKLSRGTILASQQDSKLKQIVKFAVFV